MEMEMEMNDDLGLTIDRLTAAASQLEQTIAHLEEKLAAAEQKLATLQATAEAGAPFKLCLGGNAAATPTGNRKTLPTAMTTLLAKQGVTLDTIEAGAIDAALVSLSIEQRIAVKAHLLRAGLLS
jgi:hypothetical protein